MVEPMKENIFIVIAGHHPKVGKRERISRVRAHITKQHFRRLRNKAGPAEVKQKQALPVHSTKSSSNPSLGHSRYMEMSYSVPATIQAMLDPASLFAAETTRRMHKFFDSHLHGRNHGHPFFRNVVVWSITDPPFMSAKLLNASGWDDILESGKLSPWTTRQRFVTIKLLSDTLANGIRAVKSDSTVAAFQALLGFELLIGNDQNISRLQKFHESLLAQSDELHSDVSTFFKRGHYLLSCADRLRQAGDGQNPYTTSTYRCSEAVADSQLFLDHQFVFPVDLLLFTFGQSSSDGNYHLIYILLCDLFHILSIAASSDTTPLNQSAYKYVVSQHMQLLPYVSDQDTTNVDHNISERDPKSNDTIDQRLEALRLSTFILTSWILSSREEQDVDQAQNLAKLASRLRAVLGSTNTGSHDNANWAALPGALMWCHSIGLRFSDPRCDRTWFLMQFLRVSHLGVLETWEETSRSLEIIVCTLESFGPRLQERHDRMLG